MAEQELVLPADLLLTDLDGEGDGGVHAAWSCARCGQPGALSGSDRSEVLVAVSVRWSRHDEMCAARAAELDQAGSGR